jgi:hypothetical protein
MQSRDRVALVGPVAVPVSRVHRSRVSRVSRVSRAHRSRVSRVSRAHRSRSSWSLTKKIRWRSDAMKGVLIMGAFQTVPVPDN